MQPGDYLSNRADEPAVIMAPSGTVVTYGELGTRSKQLAQLLYAAGLRTGDHIAILLENNARYFEVFWAAQRSGLYVTPINWHLNADEAAYIVDDCGAVALITSAGVGTLAADVDKQTPSVRVKLVIDGPLAGFDRYEDEVAKFEAEPLVDEVEGMFMFYSSGTTGQPKGIKPPLGGEKFGEGVPAIVGLIQMMYGFTSDTIYLCPAPLYHAAPLGWTTAVHRLGGTVVVMERFDPGQALALIEQYKVTHAQFVPTHFIRMLKLDDATRAAHDLSSLQTAVHAAAPCPTEVKQRMIDWWGECIFEYYAGSEGNGFCAISSPEWLTHVGSVGKAMIGTIHILDEDGAELPTGEAGQIWFESDTVFEYHNDPEKTAAAFNSQGWSSLGDVGYTDEEGYLYLTDRVSHMIISGGVNIYPQEVENELAMHPKVADVAVVGVPNADFGEEVKAVVIAADGHEPSSALAQELIDFCLERLAKFKCPASVDFVAELPRLPTGKLLKRKLRDQYQ
jgi:long-chain acyl-CoA synthetase